MNVKQFKKSTIIILYLISSLITITINKYLLSILHMKSQFIFLFLQSMIVSLLCVIFYYFDLIELKVRHVKYWFPLSILLTVMIYTSSKTLEYLSISVFTLFKNTSIILIALIEWYTLKKNIDLKSWLAFLLMSLSSYVGEKQELKFIPLGYFFMILNVLSTTVYVLFLKYILDRGVSKADPVFFCNLFSLPQLLICSYFFESFNFNFKNLELIMIFISGISAFFTSFTTCSCLSKFSSTTLSMLGAINKLLMSFSGIVFIGESNVGFMKIGSLILGCVSGFLYSYRIKKE